MQEVLGGAWASTIVQEVWCRARGAWTQERESARIRERLRGKKRGGKCGVRMREGKMMEEQGSVEQMRGAGEVCWGMWEENKKARMRESTGGKAL